MPHANRVVFTTPGTVTLEPRTVDVDDLGPHEVVVRSHVSVISPGTELARLFGWTLADSGRPPRFPREDVGYANVGTVLAAGRELAVKPGNRVYTMAPHASVVRVDARTALCVPVPDSLPDEQAAFARFAVVSMTTMLTTTARGGDEVAVVGLGLVGNLAAQVLQTAGMRVHTLDLSEHRRELARRCGVGHVDGPEVTDDLRRRHRLVIEASGSAQALVTAVRLAADGGEVVMVGAPWAGETNTVPTGAVMGEIFLRFLTLRSGSEWRIPVLPAPLAVGSIQQNTVTALDWIASGRLCVEPLITHRLPAEQVAQAYDGLREKPNDYLGVVLTWP